MDFREKPLRDLLEIPQAGGLPLQALLVITQYPFHSGDTLGRLISEEAQRSPDPRQPGAFRFLLGEDRGIHRQQPNLLSHLVEFHQRAPGPAEGANP